MALPILNSAGWQLHPALVLGAVLVLRDCNTESEKKRCKMLHLFGNQYGVIKLRQ
jgi:hypothetical protein